MKKIILISVAMAAVIAILAFRTVNKPVQEETTVKAGDKVEVFYFHLTRRCVTCMAVENETRKSLEELYPDLMKKGTVSFASINLEEESSEAVAERCKVTGQALLVVSGDVRIDLTDKGFMYAAKSPEKLKEEIKKAVGPLLNPVK